MPSFGMIGGMAQATMATLRAIEKERTNKDFIEVIERGIQDMVENLDGDTENPQQQANLQELQELQRKLVKVRSKRGWQNKLSNFMGAAKRKDDLMVSSHFLASLERKHMNQRLQRIDTTISRLQDVLVNFIETSTTNNIEQRQVATQVKTILNQLSTTLHSEAEAHLETTAAQYDQATDLPPQHGSQNLLTATICSAELHPSPPASPSSSSASPPSASAPPAPRRPNATRALNPASTSAPRGGPPHRILPDMVGHAPPPPHAPVRPHAPRSVPGPASTATAHTSSHHHTPGNAFRSHPGPSPAQGVADGPPANPNNPFRSQPPPSPSNACPPHDTPDVPPDTIMTTSFSLSDSPPDSGSSSEDESEGCLTDWSGSPSPRRRTPDTRSPFAPSRPTPDTDPNPPPASVVADKPSHRPHRTKSSSSSSTLGADHPPTDRPHYPHSRPHTANGNTTSSAYSTHNPASTTAGNTTSSSNASAAHHSTRGAPLPHSAPFAPTPTPTAAPLPIDPQDPLARHATSLPFSTHPHHRPSAPVLPSAPSATTPTPTPHTARTARLHTTEATPVPHAASAPTSRSPPRAKLPHSKSDAHVGRMESGARRELEVMRSILEAATHPEYFVSAFGEEARFVTFADLRLHLVVTYGCDIGAEGDEGYCRLFPSFYNAAMRTIGRAGFPAVKDGMLTLLNTFAEALARAPGGQPHTWGPAGPPPATLKREAALVLVEKTLHRFTSLQQLLMRYQDRAGVMQLQDIVRQTAEAQGLTGRDMVSFPGFVRLLLAAAAHI